MKKILAFLLILTLGVGLFSCYLPPDISNIITITNGGSTTIPTGSLNTSTTRPSATTNKNETYPNYSKQEPDLSGFDPDELALFDDFFDSKNHISFYLDISDSELLKIQKDYENNNKSPIYRMADLYITITKPNGTELKYTIDQVGVRMKGNTSRTDFYDENTGMYNLIHFKISFQETFDEVEYYGDDVIVWTDNVARKARKNRTFATLEKIDIRWNKNDDPTYIREHYAYELYREFGVLAPHTNLASVDIGNDHAGVWMFFEPIDKVFLQKNLSPEALGGDLYKLGWTHDGATFTSFTSYGVEDELNHQFYIYDLKTNKKTSDHLSLQNLIKTINSSACNKNSFSEVVDVDYFLMYSAVSYMVGNPDDLRNNYNNTYIYFCKDNGKVIFIPYDMDRGFGVDKDWNPSGNHLTQDSPFASNVVAGDQRNPLFKKTIQNGGYFKNEFVEALKQVASSEMLTNTKFEESFNLAKNLYSTDTTPSKTYGNAQYHNFKFDINKTCGMSDDSNLSFKEYISAKKTTLAKYIDGYTPDIDNSQTPVIPEVKEWELYLRGNFDNNNWENYNGYKMNHIGDGVYSITVTPSYSTGDAGTFKFKIYNAKQSGDGAWYNTVDESKINTSFVYENKNGNMNIQVALGTYTIYFDSNTETVYFEKK